MVMKKAKTLLAVFLLTISLFCGCGAPSGQLATMNVRTLKNWMFQFNSGTNEYNLFFALFDEDDKNVDADIDVDVRIEDESGNVLYKKTHTVTRADYGDYSSTTLGEMHLACVRIPKSYMKAGVSSNGKVYLKVYKKEVVEFDEVNCDAFYCLPVKDVKVVCESLPVELNIKDYRGAVESVIRVEEVKYSFDSSITMSLKIELTGTKIKDIKSSYSSLYDMFNYKLYDSEGFIIDTGTVYLSSLSEGDKFREEISVYKDITPGETYTIKFEEHSY